MNTSPRSSSSAAEAAEVNNIRSYNARLGLWLFAIYLAAYGSFVGLAAMSPDVMGRSAWGGVNIAVLYGFGLILGAFVISIVYMLLCRTPRQA